VYLEFYHLKITLYHVKKEKISIVWFKRDLRVEDHAPLVNAAWAGYPILPLFISEPEYYQQPDMAGRHWDFWADGLRELLGKIPLHIHIGDAVEILRKLSDHYDIQGLYSHMETGNMWTYKRDLRVKDLCKGRSTPWHEYSQNAVIRRLKSRNGWARQWDELMTQPILPVPQCDFIAPDKTKIPTVKDLGIETDYCPERQIGTRAEALEILNSFLYHRGEHYQKAMSSPNRAFEECSRLSPHIASGVISLREINHAVLKRMDELRAMPRGTTGKWLSAMRSFHGRLHWHCHFMQKLEDAPRIEFENMHPIYDGLRDNDFDQEKFDAWKDGRTGFPIVDASMRALKANGWINFRMRAMLVSFACYHLWLDWRPVSRYLATLFTDYEPGIHYSQCQMQAGTTGINAIRIYSPTKQQQDHDPDFKFAKQWIPEFGGLDYPDPIIDERAARKYAADRVYGLRKSKEHKDIAGEIVRKHGSRKSGLKRTVDRKPKKQNKQMDLFNEA
jgi:deoxyribodipyrimidine photo-lyase